MNTQGSHDVLIVGGGIMGAALANQLRDAMPELDIAVVDAGEPIGAIRGRHLHDVNEPEIRAQYAAQVASGVQASYLTATNEARGEERSPGLYELAALGHEMAELPGASVGWNAGGMGIHWTAAVPRPRGSEIPRFIPITEWNADADAAARLLWSNTDAYPATEISRAVDAAVADALQPRDSRETVVQPMPMAIRLAPDARMQRLGPADLFPALASPATDAHFTLYEGTAVRIRHDDGIATGVVIAARANDGTIRTTSVGARHVVVAADALRTPQLLFASDVRPAALGRYLNEHAMLIGRVGVHLERFALDASHLPAPTKDEWAVASRWVPFDDDAMPVQCQFMDRNDTGTNDASARYSMGLTVYVPLEVNAENRIEFISAGDDTTLPLMRAHYRLSDTDLKRIEHARGIQERAARAVGTFDRERDSELIPAGASMHITGTVRMSPHDDGTGVCDPHGRLWGFANLYAVGCGVLPTPIAANTTLAGVVTAVRTARALLGTLSPSATQPPSASTSER